MKPTVALALIATAAAVLFASIPTVAPMLLIALAGGSEVQEQSGAGSVIARYPVREAEERARKQAADANRVYPGIGAAPMPVRPPAASLARGCSLPKPADGDLIVVLSTHEGAAISSVAVAGRDSATTAARVVIDGGDQPLYLILSSYGPMIWTLEGATHRVTRVILDADYPSTKVVPAGLTGLPKEKVTFSESRDCMRYFDDPHSNAGSAAVGSIAGALGRWPDMLAGLRDATGISLPSARGMGPHPSTTKVPSGFDAEAWEELLRFSPAGLLTIDSKDVVSAAPAVAYDVLPQEAGLAQLIGSGMIVRAKSTLRIIKPIARYPAELNGAHSVKFAIAAGVPSPGGDPGHSCVTMEATGHSIAKGGKCQR